MLESDFGYWQVVEDPAAGDAPDSTASLPHIGKTSPSDQMYSPQVPGHLSPAPNASEVGESGHQPLENEPELQVQDPDAQPRKPTSVPTTVKPVTHEQFQRMKRASRSPVWSVLQIALGGLAAIPIALLILWHLLDRDVAGAGPKVAAYAPWLVPEKFHSLQSKQSPSQRAEFSQSKIRQPGESGFRRFDDVMPKDALADPSLDDEEMSEIGREAESNHRQRFQSGGGQQLGRDEPLSTEPTADEKTASTAPLETPTPQTRNILLLIERCKEDLDAWPALADLPESEDAVAELRKRAQQLYRNLADLSQVISELPESNPVLRAIRDAMRPIGRGVKQQPGVQDVVKQGARHWLSKYTDQPRLPLALVLEIGSVQETDSGWEVVPSPTSSPLVSVRIAIPKYLAPSLIPGQKLLLLGILKQESERLLGDDVAPNPRLFEASYLYGL